MLCENVQCCTRPTGANTWVRMWQIDKTRLEQITPSQRPGPRSDHIKPDQDPCQIRSDQSPAPGPRPDQIRSNQIRDQVQGPHNPRPDPIRSNQTRDQSLVLGPDQIRLNQTRDQSLGPGLRPDPTRDQSPDQPRPDQMRWNQTRAQVQGLK